MKFQRHVQMVRKKCELYHKLLACVDHTCKKIEYNNGIIRSFQWVATEMRQPTARAGKGKFIFFRIINLV